MLRSRCDCVDYQSVPRLWNKGRNKLVGCWLSAGKSYLSFFQALPWDNAVLNATWDASKSLIMKSGIVVLSLFDPLRFQILGCLRWDSDYRGHCHHCEYEAECLDDMRKHVGRRHGGQTVCDETSRADDRKRGRSLSDRRAEDSTKGFVLEGFDSVDIRLSGRTPQLYTVQSIRVVMEVVGPVKSEGDAIVVEPENMDVSEAQDADSPVKVEPSSVVKTEYLDIAEVDVAHPLIKEEPCSDVKSVECGGSK
ncbi:hypothetical protein AAG570_007537 [Ranatra chinensis]|uniref:Uncharacterized protein n=1 Tax=Ranatra chinensis TaxID=642074 RepID=A0ABD0XWH8_9HEMI